LIPVQTLGTIEFRHLPGTCDFPRILDWLNLIGCLFATARKHSFDDIKSFIIQVNTTSEYKHLVQRVFGEWERVLDMPFMEMQLEEGILDVKYILLSASPKEQQPYKMYGFENRMNVVEQVNFDREPPRADMVGDWQMQFEEIRQQEEQVRALRAIREQQALAAPAPRFNPLVRPRR
jgi:hypothetical protein